MEKNVGNIPVKNFLKLRDNFISSFYDLKAINYPASTPEEAESASYMFYITNSLKQIKEGVKAIVFVAKLENPSDKKLTMDLIEENDFIYLTTLEFNKNFISCPIARETISYFPIQTKRDANRIINEIIEELLNKNQELDKIIKNITFKKNFLIEEYGIDLMDITYSGFINLNREELERILFPILNIEDVKKINEEYKEKNYLKYKAQMFSFTSPEEYADSILIKALNLK